MRPNRKGAPRKQIVDGKRECSKCKEWKPLSEFSKDKHIFDGLDTKCRDCKSITNNHHGPKRYGITRKEYNQLLQSQEGLCAICRRPERSVYGRTGETKQLAVDHCHKTGRVRGLLCVSCNNALGRLEDDVETAQRLVDYLLTHA